MLYRAEVFIAERVLKNEPRGTPPAEGGAGSLVTLGRAVFDTWPISQAFWTLPPPTSCLSLGTFS